MSEEALPFIGNIASILGLLLSLYILRRVSSLAQWYQRKARLPQVTKQIKEISGRIAGALGSYATSYEEINDQLSVLYQSLQSNKHLFQGSVRNHYKVYIRKYRKVHPLKAANIDHARDLHRTALMIVAGLEELAKNEQWRAQNA